MYTLDDYDYDLPEELIAQAPTSEREGSRLLHLSRSDGNIDHRQFTDIAGLLHPSDLLIVNNTRVVPARLYGHKQSGGKVELLILDYGRTDACGQDSGRVYHCLIKASKQAHAGTRLIFEQGLIGEVLGFSEGVYKVLFTSGQPFGAILDRIGRMPLPPYIKRSASHQNPEDRVRYQTVYASEQGAIAAPTAGLHFSEATLSHIRARGTAMAAITLHVGYGTFVPVRVDDIRDHRMHEEWFHIPDATARLINRTKQAGRRVVAVGTTSVRTLEFAARPDGTVASGSGRCDLFIYPGYRFKVVDAMLTNFHLPRSTLLMLVSAFAGRETLLRTYAEAVKEKYRFFSYGDAMFIE